MLISFVSFPHRLRKAGQKGRPHSVSEEMLSAIKVLTQIHQIPMLLNQQRSYQPSTREFPQDPTEDIQQQGRLSCALCTLMGHVTVSLNTDVHRPLDKKRVTFLAAHSTIREPCDQSPQGSDHQNGEKQEPRGILQTRGVLQVHSTRRVEVRCQNRDSLNGRRLFTFCMPQPFFLDL